MSAVTAFPHARGNIERHLSAYEKGYNAAIAVVVPEIKRQRKSGFEMGVSLGMAVGAGLGIVIAWCLL